MDKGLYVAMTGASATLRAQAGVAHNLANIDTVGFKAELAATRAFPIEGEGWRSRINTAVERGRFDDASGPLIDTGNTLDIALRPGHWLAVQDAAGEEAYASAGNLSLTEFGQLVTSRGDAVLDQSGIPVAVPPHTSLSLASDGTLSIVPLGQSADTVATVARIKTVRADATVLARGEDGLMRANSPLEAAAGPVLDSGVVEGSNVSAPQMLVQMIDLSRRFEMQIKMIRSVEENAQASNSLMRIG